MLKYRLTRTERTGNKSGTAFHYRIDSIDHTHTGFKQLERTRFFFIIRHSPLHRPFLDHIHFNGISFFVHQNGNHIFNLVIAFGNNRLHRANTFLSERHHNLQWLEVLVHLS